MLDLLAEILEYLCDLLYERLLELVETHWANVEPSFNHGQQAIFYYHMQSVIWEWLDQAWDDWPFADADQYVEQLWYSYDIDVIERAFSEAINSPVERMWEIIERAINLWLTAQALKLADAAMGDSGKRPRVR